MVDTASGTIRFRADLSTLDTSLSPMVEAMNLRYVSDNPNITIELKANAATVSLMDEVQYTIYFNNTGMGYARFVWIDLALPKGVLLGSDNASVSNGTKTDDFAWYFQNVTPGNHYFVVNVMINATIESTVLTTLVHLNYTDAIGNMLESSHDDVTIHVVSPLFHLYKEAEEEDVHIGDIIHYQIYYNNSGSSNARHVWINDTLDQNIVYVECSDGGMEYDNTVRWHFSNVSQGNYKLYLNVTVKNDINVILKNTAVLNYTDENGNKLAEIESNTVLTRVNKITGPVEQLYWLWLLVIPLIAVLAYVAYRKKFPKAIIEEVFLIYKNGCLIAHNTRRLKPDIDDDILSAMLTAVQDFIKDSFKDENYALKKLEFGEKKLLIERGKNVYIAVVYAGKKTDVMVSKMKGLIGEIEEKYHDILEDWDGDLDRLRGAREALKGLFK